MSLRPLNRDPTLMSGDYAKMFEIPSHQSNATFVANPYVLKNPACSRAMCFSLTHGQVPCRVGSDGDVVDYKAEGTLVTMAKK